MPRRQIDIKELGLKGGQTLTIVNILTNLKSSVTVTLIAIPMSLALAVAGGAHPMMGLIAAVWGGFFGSIAAGSQYTVFGPSAALAGVLTTVSVQYGSETLPWLAILAGIFSIILWALKWHRYALYLPGAVVHGFTIGVAFMLGAGQLKNLLGLNLIGPCPEESGEKEDVLNWNTWVLGWFTGGSGSGPECMVRHHQFILSLFETLKHIGSTDLVVLAFWFVNAAILFTVAKLQAKWKWLGKIPWVIIISCLGILFGFLQVIPLITFGDIYVMENVSIFSFPTGDSFTTDMLSVGFFQKALTLALVGLLETLVSGRISDCISHARQDQRREVLGYGLSNIAAGVFGGIGVAGALARTVLNINSGATNRLSGIFCAIWVGIVAVVALPLIRFLPPATLAAILTTLSIRLVDVAVVKQIWTYDRKMFWIGVITCILCVVWEIFSGVIVGMVLSMLISFDDVAFGFSDAEVVSARSTTSLRGVRVGAGFQVQRRVLTASPVPGLEASQEMRDPSTILVYFVNDILTHINGPNHEQRLYMLLKEYPVKSVLIDLERCPHITLDGVNSLGTMAAMGNLYFTFAQDASMSATIPFLQDLRANGRLFENKEIALHAIQTAAQHNSSGSSQEDAELGTFKPAVAGQEGDLSDSLGEDDEGSEGSRRLLG